MKINNLLIALGLVTFVIIARLLPHPANFAPVAAVALFAGVYFSGRLALALPIVAMLLSDFLLGFYDWRLMSVVYFSFAVVGLIGRLIKKQKNVLTVITGSLAGSLLFFIATNLAVWLFADHYAKDWSGLMTAYTLAIPFFRQTVAGDLFYAGLFFGSYEAAIYFYQRLVRRLASADYRH